MRDLSRNPYIGARPFERDDKLYFFGRDEEARQLTSLVIAHRVVLFYAPSGAGKTSLLKAKVIPELEERRRVRVLPVSRVGGDLPRNLDGDRIGNIYIFNTLMSLAGNDARPAELTGLGLVDGLRPYLEPVPDEERLRPRLLILDQFEELFTTHPDRADDRADFFRHLLQCLDAYAQLSLLITMREDYIANLDFYAAQVPDRLRTRFRMELLSRDGALAAVKKPAEAAKCSFANGVAETLVDNLRRLQPGRKEEGQPVLQRSLGAFIEPVHLQIVCRQLWAKLPPEREMFELQDIDTFGNVDKALQDFYEDALKKVFDKVPVGQRRVRLWFDRSLITSARTRSLVYRDNTETAGLPNAVVQVFYDEYIIRPVVRGNDVWYELAHDRLVEPILEANRRWRAERPGVHTPAMEERSASRMTAEDAAVSLAPIPELASAEVAQTSSILSSSSTIRNPYVGVRPFQRGEHLYGRVRETNALLDLLINERIVLLYSPVGAGKSSFINAALIPELEREGFRILGPVHVGLERHRETFPETPNAETTNRYVFSVLLSLESRKETEGQISEEALVRMSLADYLSRYPGRPAECQGDVWIFDQLEEIVTLEPFDFQGKAEFFKQVGQVLNTPDQWALFTLREEFIAGLDSYLRFIPGALSTRFRLEPLNAETAREYITRAAAEAGVVFTEAAVKTLVDKLRTVHIQLPDGSTETRLSPYLEPLPLQLVCRRLWEVLPARHKRIDVEDVQAFGDLGDTLRSYYEESVMRASATTGVPERVIRNWINSQLITKTGDRGRVRHGLKESGGLDNRAVMSLLDAQMLRAEAVGGGIWYELVNNYMVEPVRESNRVWFERHLSILYQQAVLWEQAGRPNGLLLRGEDLVSAEAWAGAHPDELNRQEAEFLDLSRQAQRTRWLELQLDLSETGWGVIFAYDANPTIREALKELLTHRKRQAGTRYKEYLGEDGYHPGDRRQFLARQGVIIGEPDLDKVPYYLLIVGSPEAIPFEFQYQFGPDYAVGRLHFDTLEEYARYARSVVEAETRPLALQRRMVLFGVNHPDVPVTRYGIERLIKPLAETLEQRRTDWEVQVLTEPQETTKTELARLLGGDKTPALLFTFGSSLSFTDPADARIPPYNGALICSDYPGPHRWSGEISSDFYFSGDDIQVDGQLWGLISFHMTSFSAGTPRVDNFAIRRFEKPKPISAQALLARLPQRLLSYPNRGALAVIGHVDRIWSSSFRVEGQHESVMGSLLASAIGRLIEGYPVGFAIEGFRRHYLEYAAQLSEMLLAARSDDTVNPYDTAELETIAVDLRNYIVIGDPAVRLMVTDLKDKTPQKDR